MNRIIKFRAYDLEYNEMYNNAYPFEHLVYVEIDFEGERKTRRDLEINGKSFYFILAKDVSLMQFTGLHDKNGKEIYEGDIIKYCGIGVPFSDIKNPTFKITENTYWTMNEEVKWNFHDSIVQGEIIGNIFENPELLK